MTASDSHPTTNTSHAPATAADQTTAILSAQAVTKTLSTTDVNRPDNKLTLFNKLELTLAPGERLAIMGTSGVGKSTLLACLAGLDDIDSGTITLLGEPLTQLSLDARAQLRQQKIGFVFQNFQLVPHLSALENVALSLEIAGHGRDEARALAQEALNSVGLAQRAHHWPHQLSGGEQQRVAIARASSRVPTLIFADEPTGNLDPKTGTQIMDVLLALSETQNTALVVVTHDFNIAQCCQRQLQLTDGKLVAL